ncbi:hypothetical protein [Demequina capsici]|uniref:Uncharacterized protein n=1 Tax=Demequina capsici TaxID=3075620 RepID=A0AA96F6H9_9MICO|nr:hypothetical protein [Demequina sp. OYTSA14]WNM24753.1 hypothetical protein RN606_00965 [Demequina sp. OYTSA14]
MAPEDAQGDDALLSALEQALAGEEPWRPRMDRVAPASAGRDEPSVGREVPSVGRDEPSAAREARHEAGHEAGQDGSRAGREVPSEGPRATLDRAAMPSPALPGRRPGEALETRTHPAAGVRALVRDCGTSRLDGRTHVLLISDQAPLVLGRV